MPERNRTTIRLLRAALGLTLVLALLAVVRSALTQSLDSAVISGTVFHDRNGNGIWDPGEPGIEGVSVSDGTMIVETDGLGRYVLPVDTDRRLTDIVFVTTPHGYLPPLDQARIPRFYRILAGVVKAEHRTQDFPLLRVPESEDPNFTFVSLADVHVQAGTTNDRERFSDQLRQLSALTGDPAFVAIAGDLTNHATDAEFQDFRAATATSRLPVWPAMGNHEYTDGPDYRTRIDNYRRHVGPEWYAFDYGRRHFVVLENHQGFSQADQLRWLEQDLTRHAREREVVVIVHKPLNTSVTPRPAADTQQYLELLGRYRTVLVLMGHTHVNDVARDVIPGAKHVVTNSSSYTIDQTPSGFRAVTFHGEKEEHPFKMYGVERALAIVNPGADQLVPRENVEVVVNAYDTSSTVVKVQYRIDGGSWRSLERSSAFTWAGEWEPRRSDTGTHRIEVWATNDAGSSWTRASLFTVSRREHASTPRAGNDWPQFHGGAQHTGVAPEALPPQLRLAWSYRTPGTILASSPAVVDGVAYVGTRDEDGAEHNGVHAVDFATGRRLWRFLTGAQVQASPAVADGIVFAGTIRGTLHALDAVSGAPRWERTVGGDEVSRAWMYNSPTVADGVVYQAYTTAAGGGVLALDTRTGAERWNSRPASFSNWISEGSPVVKDGRVYVIAHDGRILVLDVTTGAMIWSQQPAGGWMHSMPAISEGRLFVGYQGGTVIALDAITGAELWRHTSGDESYIAGKLVGSSPAVEGGTVYVGFPDGNVKALDAMTGAVRWSHRTGGGVISSPALSGGTLYVGSNDGYVYALDKLTGDTQWRYEIGAWVASSPTVSGTGLVVGAFDGNLYGFALR